MTRDPDGPVWGLASSELNATLVVRPPGRGPDEHVNAERDVLIFVVEGSATVTIDGTTEDVEAGSAVIVEKGATRRVVAGPEGVRYLSVHRRRPPLQVDAQFRR